MGLVKIPDAWEPIRESLVGESITGAARATALGCVLRELIHLEGGVEGRGDHF